jgi:hypothetical protein
MTTPTPDIVQRLRAKEQYDRCDLICDDAATTIEELREAIRVRDEAIRVLAENRAARHALWTSMSRENLHRLNLAEHAVDANPIARDACKGSTTETRTLPPLGH